MAETVGLLILTPLFAEASAFGTISVVSAGAATLVGSAVLVGGSVGLSLLLRPSAAEPAVPKPSDGTQTIKQAIPPRIFGYGRCRIAGAYMFYEVDPSSSASYDVMALCQGRIVGFQHIFLNDDLVTLDSNLVNAVIGVDPGDERYSGSAVRIELRTGISTETAHGQVEDAFPTLWTRAFHRGDGIASAMLVCSNTSVEDFTQIYPRGLPKLSVVANMLPLLDIRTGVTASDNGGASTNPVLQLVDFLTNPDYGLGLDYATLIEPNLSALQAQASICDELVARADGLPAEVRYASSGFAYMSTDPVEVIQALLAACDGWIAEKPNGSLALWVGKYQTPTVTITDDHIVGFSIDHGVADEEKVNEIRFTFTPPANDYREGPGVPWRDEDDIAESGRVRSQSMSLTWVQSHAQARRIAKRTMARYLAPLRGSMSCTLYGLKVLGERWVRIQSTVIEDLEDAVVEVTRMRVDLSQARVTFDWIIVNPDEIDAWDPPEEQGETPDFPGKLTLVGVQS